MLRFVLSLPRTASSGPTTVSDSSDVMPGWPLFVVHDGYCNKKNCCKQIVCCEIGERGIMFLEEDIVVILAATSRHFFINREIERFILYVLYYYNLLF